MPHDIIHHIRYSCHIPAVLEKGKRKEKDEDIRQEGEDPAHTGYDPVHDQGFQQGRCPHSLKPIADKAAEPFQRCLKITFQPVAHSKCQEKYKRHNKEKDREPQPLPGHKPVRLLRTLLFLALIDQSLLDHFLYEIILFIDNVLLVTAVRDPRQIRRVLLQHRPVLFQSLDGMPAHILHLRIFLPVFLDHCIDLVLDLIIIHHRVFTVMVMFMAGPVRVMVDERSGLCIFIVVSHRVHEDLQPAPLPRRNRDRGDPQHFRQTVQVEFHAPLFHHIHHVQSQHDRLAQLDQLEGQIQVPLQAGSVHHIHDHIHLIAHDALPGHLLFHRIGGQAVNTRQVDQLELLSLVGSLPLLLLHCNSGPVRDL